MFGRCTVTCVAILGGPGNSDWLKLHDEQGLPTIPLPSLRASQQSHALQALQQNTLPHAAMRPAMHEWLSEIIQFRQVVW